MAPKAILSFIPAVSPSRYLPQYEQLPQVFAKFAIMGPAGSHHDEKLLDSAATGPDTLTKRTCCLTKPHRLKSQSC